jgi:translin
VDVPAWLNGLSEVIGELRRYILDLLRRGDYDRCEGLLSQMDDMYSLLVTIDYPDAITGNLRRATDVARSILEKTRGDLTVSLVQKDLKDAVERHGERGGN